METRALIYRWYLSRSEKKMKKYLQVIVIIYIGLFLISLITPIAYPQLYYLYAYTLHFIVLGVFIVGYKSFNRSQTTSVRERKIQEELSIRPIPMLSIKSIWGYTFLVAVFVPLYVRFYTGEQWHTQVLAFFVGNSGQDSTYYIYQNYFADAGLSQMSLSKLPYVLGYGILKYTYILLMLSLSTYQVSLRKVGVPIGILCFLFMSVGMSRGTSIEIFEVFTLLMYVAVLKSPGKISLKSKGTIAIVLLVTLGILYFMTSLALRYEDRTIIESNNLTFKLDEDSFVSTNAPFLAMILNRLSGYFVFGFYYISHCFNDIWTTSIDSFYALLIPNGLPIMDIGPNTKSLLCGKVIDCGAMWIPDIVTAIERYGLIATLIAIYFIGVIFRRVCENYLTTKNIFFGVALYYITLQMFSLQIGNFLTSSSSSIICVSLTIASLAYPRMFQKTFNDLFVK